jgi:hypothetical protein
MGCPLRNSKAVADMAGDRHIWAVVSDRNITTYEALIRLTSVARTGVLCVILCFALGIANIFHFHWVILFSVFCL